MGEFSPGRWYVQEDSEYHGLWHLASEEPEQHLAWIGAAIIGDVEGEANARLIAAAKDLLAACEAVYKKLVAIQDGGYGEHLDNPLPQKLRAAIDRAKGQPT